MKTNDTSNPESAGRHDQQSTAGRRRSVSPLMREAAIVQSTPDMYDTSSDVIPDIVIRRLPVYVRTLKGLTDLNIASVSSEELASLIGVTAAQIRRDLSYFGKFGKQGKGYNVAFLSDTIDRILKLDRQWPMVLCGMGKLGHAIANYRGFSPSSFQIVGLFDSDEEKVGETVNEYTVRPLAELVDFMHEHGITVGIIATPRVNAQETADLLVEGGVKAILNYAPVILRVPDDVIVREIDPVSALQSMTYYIDD